LQQQEPIDKAKGVNFHKILVGSAHDFKMTKHDVIKVESLSRLEQIQNICELGEAVVTVKPGELMGSAEGVGFLQSIVTPARDADVLSINSTKDN
jgi:hypothetical protein